MTTSTLVGLVRDTSNAVIPGATVVATHEGTGVTREGVSDSNGEFVFSALPAGSYEVRVELTGFKTLQNRGMQLGAGQTVRQNFTLEVGTLNETVTVAGEAPLIETAASLQADSLGAQEVSELPVSRRNLTNLMSLTAGVNTSGDGIVQMNGVAAGGTGITVDGTEANSNPEARSLSQYGGQNQISVMSLDSISEVQIVKGVLPAEYGGVAGGQVNVISRSGTNAFHGSAFYSGQNEKFNARNFFSTAQQADRHLQPVRRHVRRAGAPEQGCSSSRPTRATARRFSGISTRPCRTSPCDDGCILARCRSPRRASCSTPCNLPTEPIVSAAGVVEHADRPVARPRHAPAHGEPLSCSRATSRSSTARTWATTYTRLRPFTLEPRPVLNNANDREFPNEQDRVAASS